MQNLVWLIIPAALLGFVGIWCMVCLLISLISGWRRLAAEFPARSEPDGRLVRARYASMNSAQYKGVLNVGATPAGLYLSVVSFFRPGHPPLLIDWSAIGPFTAGKALWKATFTLPIRITGSRDVSLTLVDRDLVEEIEKYCGAGVDRQP